LAFEGGASLKGGDDAEAVRDDLAGEVEQSEEVEDGYDGEQFHGARRTSGRRGDGVSSELDQYEFVV